MCCITQEVNGEIFSCGSVKCKSVKLESLPWTPEKNKNPVAVSVEAFGYGLILIISPSKTDILRGVITV